MKPILVLIAILALATTAFAQTDSTLAPTPTTTTGAPSGEVKRALFTTAVAEREPVDEITTLAAPADKVVFFTELLGMAGKTITHKWSLDGQTMGEVAISVGADRWRCYSTKTLSPTMTGTWMVEVVDDSGAKLAEKSITFTAASP